MDIIDLIIRFGCIFIVIPVGAFFMLSYLIAFAWILTDSEKIYKFYVWAADKKRYNPVFWIAVIGISFIVFNSGLYDIENEY